MAHEYHINHSYFTLWTQLNHCGFDCCCCWSCCCWSCCWSSFLPPKRRLKKPRFLALGFSCSVFCAFCAPRDPGCCGCPGGRTVGALRGGSGCCGGPTRQKSFWKKLRSSSSLFEQGFRGA